MMLARSHETASENADVEPSAPKPTVLAVTTTSQGYGRQVLRGLIRYTQETAAWDLTHASGFDLARIRRRIDAGELSGLCTELREEALVEAVPDLPIPVVVVTGINRPTGCPHVVCDNRAVGRLAGEYFRNIGFRRIGFVGWPSGWFSKQRSEGLRRYGREVGLDFEEFWPETPTSEAEWRRRERALAGWLRDLPKPVAVVGVNDLAAAEVSLACSRLGLTVPEDVAVLGVDNDELICETTMPPLSSVDLDLQRLGYRAADILHGMLAGEAGPAEPVTIEPWGVVTRQSTDTLSVDDPALVRALRTIRERACEGLSVRDLLRVVPLSRRAIEQRFRKVLGRTIQAEIMRLRIQRAKSLLREGRVPVAEIADQCGLSSPARLSVVFKREVGLTPTDYRDRYRGGER